MEQDSDPKKSRVESEKNKALEMRQKAMESFVDTKNSNSEFGFGFYYFLELWWLFIRGWSGLGTISY